MIRAVLSVVAILLTACSQATPFPDMQPGEVGRVTRVIDGDALVLDTGQSVRLVSIEAPAMYPESGRPAPYAGESARRLEDMALGRRVQLYYPGLTRDRYDRALAHVMTIDGAGPKLWLNQEMVKAGAAWVRLYPSTSAKGQDLLLHEAEARAAKSGLWARSDYVTRAAPSVSADVRGFMFVEGTLGPLLAQDPEARFPPACRRAIAEADLILSVRRDAATLCGFQDGSTVFMRGFVSDGEIDLSHPWHAEVVSPD